MSLILNIDTALSTATISLSENGKRLSWLKNESETDHASWLHPAMADLLAQNNFEMKDLKSVAVSHGPGSYTGLRIGLAAAKGICYALDIPLICIPTLTIMAKAAVEIIPRTGLNQVDFLCPMIDARRMEVFFSLFDKNLNIIREPTAIILDRYVVENIFGNKKIAFFGSGSRKLKNIPENSFEIFNDFHFFGAYYMSEISLQYYDNTKFSDLSSTEPLYIKEFYNDHSSK